MIADWSEGITTITWNNQNKIVSIVRADTCHSPDLEFNYDAKGLRISKLIKPRTGSGLASQANWKYSYYTYNANGELVATYNRAYERRGTNTFRENIQIKQNHITDIGAADNNKLIGELTFDATLDAYFSDVHSQSLLVPSVSFSPETLVRGEKKYEQNNMRGDVAVVVADRIITENGNTKSDVCAATDYFPYGMGMPARNNITRSYDFGFEGKRSDHEVSGDFNSYDFGARMYDPRLGRWLSIDAYATKYAELSPYNFAGNSPIQFGDIDGNDITWLPYHGQYKFGDSDSYYEVIKQSMDLLYNTPETSRIIKEAEVNHRINVVVTFTDHVDVASHTFVPRFSVQDYTNGDPLALSPAVTASNGFIVLNGIVDNVNDQLRLYPLGPAAMGQDIYFVNVTINSDFNENNEPVLHDPFLIATFIAHEIESHVNIPLRMPALYKTLKMSGIFPEDEGSESLDHLLVGHHLEEGDPNPYVIRKGDKSALVTTNIAPGSTEHKFVEELYQANEFRIKYGDSWVKEYIAFQEQRKQNEKPDKGSVKHQKPIK